MASQKTRKRITAFLRRHRLAKAQSAIEFLMTHGWAIVISLSVGFTLWQLGIFNLGQGAMTASGFGQLKPILSGFQNAEVDGQDSAVLALLFVNGAGQDILVTDARIVPTTEDLNGPETATREYCFVSVLNREKTQYTRLRERDNSSPDCSQAEESDDQIAEGVGSVGGGGIYDNDDPNGPVDQESSSSYASIFPLFALIPDADAYDLLDPSDCYATTTGVSMSVPSGEPFLLIAADSCQTVGNEGAVGGGTFKYDVVVRYQVPFASPGGIEYYDRSSIGTISGG